MPPSHTPLSAPVRSQVNSKAPVVVRRQDGEHVLTQGDARGPPPWGGGAILPPPPPEGE